MKRKAIVLSILFVPILLFSGFFLLQGESFEQRRTRVLNELFDSINEAAAKGKYGG